MPKLSSAVALALVCLVDSCGQETTDKPRSGSLAEETSTASEAAFIEAMVNREDIAQRASNLTLAELFPRTGQSKVLADAFRADVVSVDAGRAFGDHFDGDPKTGIEDLAFDDPDASWRSFEVTIQVVEVYSGDVKVNTALTIGLAFGREIEMNVVSDGLMSMGQIAVFTAQGDFVVPYDRSITPVVRDGAFLSPVEGDQVPWPALGGSMDSEGSLVSQIETLTELRQLEPPQTSPLR